MCESGYQPLSTTVCLDMNSAAEENNVIVNGQIVTCPTGSAPNSQNSSCICTETNEIFLLQSDGKTYACSTCSSTQIFNYLTK